MAGTQRVTVRLNRCAPGIEMHVSHMHSEFSQYCGIQAAAPVAGSPAVRAPTASIATWLLDRRSHIRTLPSVAADTWAQGCMCRF